jgi:hypothetical protein
MTTQRAKWTRHVLPSGVVIPIPDGNPISTMGDANAGYVGVGFRPVRIGVFYGPGEDLARWREGIGRNPGATFGAESNASVCGLPARQLEGQTPTRGPDHVVTEHGPETQDNPGETFVARAFRWRDLPIVVFYVVVTDQRAAHAADETQFFAGIECPVSG